MILFAAAGVLLHYFAGIEFAPLLGLFAGLLVANFIPPRNTGCKVKDDSQQPRE